jgi:hypothetical protein
MWLFHLIDKGYELADKFKQINTEALDQSIAGAICLTMLVYVAFAIMKDIVLSYMDICDEEE